jgi:hypothetical protein
VTIEDVEDEGDFNPLPASIDQRQSDSENLGEAYTIDEDGSLTFVGFLKDLEDEPLPDFTSDSQSDDEEEDQEEDNTEIEKISDLDRFSQVLAEAQRIAVEVEDQRLKENNRPKQYLGNSARTKRRQRQIGKDLEKKGYHSIKTWFAKANTVDLGEEEASAAQNSNIEAVVLDRANPKDKSATESNSVVRLSRR